MDLTFNLSDPGSLGSLRAFLAASARPRSIVEAATRGGRKVIQAHFRDRERTPNKLGGKRTHFWADVLRSTQLGTITATQGIILIGDSRFAQKLYGGKIVPKRKKALTIPIHPDAHGRKVSVLEKVKGIKLFLIPRQKGEVSGLLAAASESGEITVYYVLRRSVTQDPDPKALPPLLELQDAILLAAQRQVDYEQAMAQL